jgi:putative flavoprotein involved in K+ transport
MNANSNAIRRTRNETTPSDSPMIEEGAAFLRLAGAAVSAAAAAAPSTSREAGAPRPATGGETEEVPIVVIGAGQSGLSVGYFLAKHGVRFVILDADARIGDVWRRRWDSLRLFTPAAFDGLAGKPFPAPAHSFPTKDDMADYLEAYAREFSLPVRHGLRVDGLTRESGRYVVTAGGHRFVAEHVVVAMATYQRPKVPAFARELDRRIVQLHSSEYRSPSQLPEGPVLVVGAGNSGAEIAIELARGGRRVWLAGRDVGEIPFDVDGLPARLGLLRFVLRVVFHRILTTDSPVGRRARPSLIARGGPLIRQKRRHLVAAGVERVGRVAGVADGKPAIREGRVLDPASVIWATGFHAGLDWIRLPVIDEHGEPKQTRGVAEGEPGLYFVGPHFLYAMSSTMIHGAARDAEHVANVVATRILEAARVRATG